jgi:hypothetical protein
MNKLIKGASPWLPQSFFYFSYNQLVQRFRPYYKFSNDGGVEDYRPCSWEWFYSHSTLKDSQGQISTIGNNFGMVLQHSDIRSPGMPYDANILINDEYEHGQSWLEALDGAGSYCHCSSITPNLINIEYWLLFGFNKTTVKGDHKGDLVCVQMVYDKQSDRIIRVTFSIHGSVIEAFGIPTGNYQLTNLQGLDINGQPITQQVIKIDIPSNLEYQKDGWWHDPSDLYLYFTLDPRSNRYEHLVVYFEWGTHEPWPNDSGSITSVPSHNGSAFSFLPNKVHLLDAHIDEPFLYFGGNLGDPVGIMRHRSWLIDDPLVNIPPNMRVDKEIYTQLGPLRWPPA